VSFEEQENEETAQYVLLVDDVPTNLRLMEHMLRDLNVQVLKSATQRDALELSQQYDLAVAVLDVNLHGSSGLVLAKKFKEDPRTRDLPIIFVTAGQDPLAKEKGYEVGAVDFLLKPIDPLLLRSKVRVFCDLQRKEHALREMVLLAEKQEASLREEIASRKQIEREFRESELRYRQLVELSPEAIVVQTANVMTFFNPAALRLFGLTKRHELEGRSIQSFAVDEDQARLQEYFDAIERQGGRAESIETRIVRPKGETVYVAISAGCVIYESEVSVQATLLDISERKRLEEHLRRLSTQDALTGVPNRRAFDEALEREWARARRDRTNLGLVMIDIDHFKLYNDAHGHQAGDLCLTHVAQVLNQTRRRDTDIVARYGGEEFALILPDTDMQGAVLIAERMREAVLGEEIPHVNSSTGPHVSISLGVAAMVPGREEDRRVLFQFADVALYEAKRSGRNRVASAGA